LLYRSPHSTRTDRLLSTDMSKFKVKATLDNTVRTVEFERQKYDLSVIKDRTAKAFGVGSLNVRYTSATGESYYLTNDQQLQKAIKDAEKSAAKFLELKVFREGGGAPAAAASTARPATSAAAPPASSAAAARPAGGAAAPAASSNALAHFKLSADPRSTAERADLEHKSESDHFSFGLKPSKYDTDVEVQLNGQALSFVLSYSYREGDLIKNRQATLGVSLPYAPTASQVKVEGQAIKIYHPQ